jgi:hypothetical protein
MMDHTHGQKVHTAIIVFFSAIVNKKLQLPGKIMGFPGIFLQKEVQYLQGKGRDAVRRTRSGRRLYVA